MRRRGCSPAVGPVSSKAAQTRFERVCIESFSPLHDRPLDLSFNTDIRAFPHPFADSEAGPAQSRRRSQRRTIENKYISNSQQSGSNFHLNLRRRSPVYPRLSVSQLLRPLRLLLASTEKSRISELSRYAFEQKSPRCRALRSKSSMKPLRFAEP